MPENVRFGLPPEIIQAIGRPRRGTAGASALSGKPTDLKSKESNPFMTCLAVEWLVRNRHWPGDSGRQLPGFRVFFEHRGPNTA